MGPGVRNAVDAWQQTALLLSDDRVLFLDEPPNVDDVLATLLRYRVPTNQLINDAYLAAFAIQAHRTLVTWDRGFLQFPGLDVSLVGA
jgi:predicted nucleic acid-binding protein